MLIHYVKYISTYTISLLIILYKLRSLFTRNLELFKIPFFKPGGGSEYNFTCLDFAFLVHSPSFFFLSSLPIKWCVLWTMCLFLFLFCLFSFFVFDVLFLGLTVCIIIVLNWGGLSDCFCDRYCVADTACVGSQPLPACPHRLPASATGGPHPQYPTSLVAAAFPEQLPPPPPVGHRQCPDRWIGDQPQHLSAEFWHWHSTAGANSGLCCCVGCYMHDTGQVLFMYLFLLLVDSGIFSFIGRSHFNHASPFEYHLLLQWRNVSRHNCVFSCLQFVMPKIVFS